MRSPATSIALLYLRFKYKTDLLAGLQKMVKQEHIQNGVILAALGSVRGYQMHQVSNRTMPSQDTYEKNPTQPADLVSMNGYVINGRIHAHVTLSTAGPCDGGSSGAGDDGIHVCHGHDRRNERHRSEPRGRQDVSVELLAISPQPHLASTDSIKKECCVFFSALIEKILPPAIVAAPQHAHDLPAGVQRERAADRAAGSCRRSRAACGCPCADCRRGSRPPGSPMSSCRRASAESRGRASVRREAAHRRSTGRCCDRAAECSSATARASGEECADTQASRMTEGMAMRLRCA